VVRYWEKWTGVEAQAMQRIVDRFNETIGAEEGIWVEYNAVSNVDQRTLIATAGGDPPDIAGLFDYAVPQFADQGALLELDSLAEQYDIDVQAFKPVLVDIGRYKGKLYAFPSTPYAIALYYNRRLFREAGLDPDRPPQTINELTQYSFALTKRDADGKITQLGFTTSPAMLGWWHWVWPCFFDAQLWDGQRFHLDTPEGRAAERWIAERRAAIGLADVIAFEASAGSIEGTQNPFVGEHLAMVFQGPWISNWVRAYAPELDYGVAPFPSVTRERQNTFVSTDVFAIPRGSRHVPEAIRFLQFVLKQETLEELCSAQCKISPFRKPLPGFFEHHPNPHIRTFDEMARSEYAFGYPAMPMWAQVYTETLFMHESVLRGVRKPDEAVRMTQQKVDSVVREYQFMSAKRHEASGREG
jgi:ABC-type glycerol-3-phosphate transport system substrate-binding protein